MIGLGSNRLSVCRRGGMRVTQAGKGGMEWLAGGRVPSWATPYSAQATAALKAQFPTQWPTIRDYGFSHPALVPFINEDPMLVMSLIDGLGTRGIIGDGVAYMITDIYIKDTWAFETDAFWTDNYNTSQAFEGIFAPDWNMAWGRYTGRGYIYFISGSSGNQPHPDFYSNTLYKVRIDGKTKKFIVNGTSYNMAGTPTGALSPVTFGLFTPNRPAEQFNPSVYWMIAKKTYAKFYDENGVLKDSLVPCKHKVNGVLKAGMLDLETAHWFGNANIVGGVEQGSFTISETPAA